MLTPAQAAFLAGLPQRPSGFNPYRKPAPALARQRDVLRRMAAAGCDHAGAGARGAPTSSCRSRGPPRRSRRAHFVERVLAASGGARPARIETTLDAGLQAEIAGIIRSQRASLDTHGASNVAVVVLDNATRRMARVGRLGRLLRRRARRRHRRRRLAAAAGIGAEAVHLRAGASRRASRRRPCWPTSRRTSRPRRRASSTARATTTAATAVRCSRGARWRARRTCRPWRSRRSSACRSCCASCSRAGLHHLRSQRAAYYGLGVTLGNAEVRLDELVAAYAAFARGGEWLAPTWRRGRAGVARERHAARLAADRLLDRRHPLGRRRARVHLRPRRQPRVPVPGRGEDRHVAGLPRQLDGRLHARRDRRRVGRQLRPHAAARLDRRHRRRPDLPRRDAGGAAARGPAAIRFGDARSPTARRPRRAGDLRRSPACRRIRGARRSSASGCRPPRTCALQLASPDRRGPACVWPPEYRQWARRSGLLADHAGRPRAVVVRPSARRRSTARRCRFEPAVRRDLPHRPDPSTRVPDAALRAVTDRSGTLEWRVDGRIIGSAASDSAIEWPLVPGAHAISVRDRDGRTADTSVIVR